MGEVHKFEEGLDHIVSELICINCKYRFLDLRKWKEIDKIMHYSDGYAKQKYFRFKKMITLYNTSMC